MKIINKIYKIIENKLAKQELDLQIALKKYVGLDDEIKEELFKSAYLAALDDVERSINRNIPINTTKYDVLKQVEWVRSTISK
jgi:hypothetical protein